MTYPRPGQFIEVEVGEWPTESHILRAADAIDVLSLPRIGAILRAVVVGIDKGGIDKERPWDHAIPGELWLLVDRNGKRHPVVRTDTGWRSTSRRKEVFQSSYFTTGHALWTEKPFTVENCRNKHNHDFYAQCNACGYVRTSVDVGTPGLDGVGTPGVD